MYKDVLGFVITPYMQRILDVNGCYASIMRTDKKAEDSDSKLPPGMPIPVLPVDYLKSRPESWIGGEGSYVCPVDPEWALWFNWSMNNTSETAILPSVKGMNPITGQRVQGLGLEEYSDECPIHKKPFSKGKLCTECGYKWPDQNFVSMPNSLHLDGYFCAGDNCVRQFFFTEEMARSIPEQVIGKEDTVPAFGFCFYQIKDKKTEYEKGNRHKNEFPKISSMVSNSLSYFSEERTFCYSPNKSKTLTKRKKFELGGNVITSMGGMFSSSDYEYSDKPVICSDAAAPSVDFERSFTSNSLEVRERSVSTFYSSVTPEPIPEVGVGAGAKIKQDFKKSCKSVDLWEKKPKGVMRVYFVFQEEFQRYAAEGFNDLKGSDSGYLEGLIVGGAS